MKKFHVIVLMLLPLVVVAEDTLPVSLQSALNYRDVPHDSLSVYVENLETGEVMLRWNDAELRNPASVAKSVTTFVALEALGPTFRWKTDVYFLGEVEDGVLEGDLLLKGFGDPFLVTEQFWKLLRQIRNAGVTSINGNLLLDDSYFDVGEYDPGAFDREPLRAYNVAPNALLANYKAARFLFEPNITDDTVTVTLEPPLENLKIVNRLRLANMACRGYQRGITITPNKAFDEITLTGQFPNGCEQYAMTRAVLSHNEFTYGLFRSLWEEAGGEISGGWRNIEYTPIDESDEPDISFDSLPLADVITRVNKHSNNVMARHLLYTLGAEYDQLPGTEEKGRRFVREWLSSKGLDTSELDIDNGSGLSRQTRVSARQLGAMLRIAYSSQFMPEYMSSMALSGLDGTLSRRLRSKDLAGMAHIKTGSLDHVSSFAGYMQSRVGDRYIVVSLQNYKDVHRGPGDEVQEALLRWVYEQGS